MDPLDLPDLLFAASTVAPALLMATAALLPLRRGPAPWSALRTLCGLALAAALLAPALRAAGGAGAGALPPGLAASVPGAWMALLVQLLGMVIGVFSSRCLAGERGQRRFIAAFAAVLAAVQLLLLADHWGVLIGAWAAVGIALQRLLCFYPERPFALLAAHKKRLADRLADGLLLAAAGCAWAEVGSGSLSALWQHAAGQGAGPLLQASALCLVAAVLLRTAVLPVHGWLIQVMEAPTPVSALLHAGVVNLGGFLLIRFAPLLDATPAARWLLVAAGLATAVLAGLVMLTRISIKLRLAWSTVAQMGFLVLTCGLGLYSLAALHLVGHALYKAHAFLGASGVVRQTRLHALQGPAPALSAASLWAAPLLSLAVVAAVVASAHALLAPLLPPAWPLWWSGVLALAWAPLWWLPAQRGALAPAPALHLLAAAATTAGLTTAALLAHALPLGVADAPLHAAGWVALAGMALLALSLIVLQRAPQRLAAWRRWSHAGFYVDEAVTRLTLRLWPTRWSPPTPPTPAAAAAAATVRPARTVTAQA